MNHGLYPRPLGGKLNSTHTIGMSEPYPQGCGEPKPQNWFPKIELLTIGMSELCWKYFRWPSRLANSRGAK